MKIPRVFAILVLCLSSCSDAVPEEYLPGIYVASFRGEKATLSLRVDHTYTHIIHLKDGQTLEAKATWTVFQVNSRLTRTVVEFSKFNVIPSYREVQKPSWATEVERTWLGQLQLCFDSDVGYCYVKQNGS